MLSGTTWGGGWKVWESQLVRTPIIKELMWDQHTINLNCLSAFSHFFPFSRTGLSSWAPWLARDIGPPCCRQMFLLPAGFGHRMTSRRVFPTKNPGLLIRIPFLRSGSICCSSMRIRIQLKNLCNKFPYKEFSWVEKDKKDCSRVKKTTMELVKIYLFFLSIKLQYNYD